MQAWWFKVWKWRQRYINTTNISIIILQLYCKLKNVVVIIALFSYTFYLTVNYYNSNISYFYILLLLKLKYYYFLNATWSLKTNHNFFLYKNQFVGQSSELLLSRIRCNMDKRALKLKAMSSSIRYHVNNSDFVKSAQFTPRLHCKLHRQCETANSHLKHLYLEMLRGWHFEWTWSITFNPYIWKLQSRQTDSHNKASQTDIRPWISAI